MPLVFVDRAPAVGIAADVVAVNHRMAAKQAIHHLVELGHRSIGMVIGNDRASSVLDRIDGYESALREHGITPEPEYLFHLDKRGGDGKLRPEEILDRIAKDENGLTAIFAVNDLIAFHLLDAAEAKGIRIPEQLSLVGFDWLARWMPSGGNLTTVAQPFEEIGRAVAERVLSRLATPTQTPRQILFDAELILKDSTAPPPQRAALLSNSNTRKQS
jgi:LacI family transcriptional regulator